MADCAWNLGSDFTIDFWFKSGPESSLDPFERAIEEAVKELSHA